MLTFANLRLTFVSSSSENEVAVSVFVDISESIGF